MTGQDYVDGDTCEECSSVPCICPEPTAGAPDDDCDRPGVYLPGPFYVVLSDAAAVDVMGFEREDGDTADTPAVNPHPTTPDLWRLGPFYAAADVDRLFEVLVDEVVEALERQKVQTRRVDDLRARVERQLRRGLGGGAPEGVS